MKCVVILALLAAAAASQTATASITGKVLDAKTQKPIPVALVRAIRSGLPPFASTAKTGADGAFRFAGL